jgi:hypothetical protein
VTPCLRLLTYVVFGISPVVPARAQVNKDE